MFYCCYHHRCPPADFVQAIHCFVDFIYLAQNPLHTPSIKQIRDVLAEFHLLKHVILEEGAYRGKRVILNHFDLPKLELMQSFATSVDLTGSLPQWTADVSEHLLIMHCKQPFEQASNRKTLQNK